LPATLHFPSDALIARLMPLTPVPGLPGLRAHQARDVFALWQAWEHESGEKQDVPYWATVWPAALLMASFLAEEPAAVAGKTVLDFGCGSGIPGLAAARAEARRVLANDIDPVALGMAERNARANGIALETEEGNLLRQAPAPEWDVILVADLFYEKSVAEPMLLWLRAARENGSRVFIADASRPFTPATGVKILREREYPTDPDLEGSTRRIVRVLEFLP
jgi:predicted nicotinamide N-methyase